MNYHIKKLLTDSFFQLRQLRLIIKYLEDGSLVTLIHSFVHSRLDYFNNLFYGIANKDLALSQSVQNRAAKIVVGGLRHEHVTPILRNLHWLPVNKRIVYKIPLFMFKCLNGMVPRYLADRFAKNTDVFSYSTRFQASNCVLNPATRLQILWRSFAIAGPTMWNALPFELRQPGLTLSDFKNRLKTHLFS